MTPDKSLEQAYKLYQANKLDEADQIIATLIEKHKGIAKAHQLRALVFRAQGKILEAITEIKLALDIQPDDPESLNTYGNLLSIAGQVFEAEAAYKQSLKLAPNYVQPAQNLGELYLIQKDPGRAAAVFSEGLKHHQNHLPFHHGLMLALKDSGQFNKALALMPALGQVPGIAINAGQCYLGAGQVEAAISAFKQGLNDQQSAGQAMRNLVQISHMQSGKAEAVQTLKTILKEAAANPSIRWEAADIFNDLGDDKNAVATLDLQDKDMGPHPFTDFVRSTLLIDAGDGEGAFALAQKALSARPGDLAIMAALARAALMVGKPDIAVQAAQAAIPVNPNNQFWIAILATGLRALGQEYKSLYDYDKLVRVYDLEAPPEYDTQAQFLKALKSVLESLHKSSHHPIGQTLRNGSQTSFDLRFSAERVVQDFFQSLEAPIQDYMDIIGTDKNHPLSRRNTKNYRLTGAWSIKLRAGGFHVNHVHPEGWISSSFYIDVPEGIDEDPDKSGWIKFGEPPFKVKGLEAEHWIAPKPGRLVLFPSYMWHGTMPIKKGQSRMTLPFDVVPA